MSSKRNPLIQLFNLQYRSKIGKIIFIKQEIMRLVTKCTFNKYIFALNDTIMSLKIIQTWIKCIKINKKKVGLRSYQLGL